MTTLPVSTSSDLTAEAEIAYAYAYQRLCLRIKNAFELQCELVVLVTLISDTGHGVGGDWTALEKIEMDVNRTLLSLPKKISLPNPVRWYLERAQQGNLVEKSGDCYRIKQLGVACVIDHSNRLQRHNAWQWEKKWQENRLIRM